MTFRASPKKKVSSPPVEMDPLTFAHQPSMPDVVARASKGASVGVEKNLVAS